MYSKKHRLTSDKGGFQSKNILRTSLFSVKVSESRKEHNRFAIVIPKRNVNKATQRNYWKRRIADLVKKWPNMKKDLVFVASVRIKESSQPEIEKEFEKILKDIKNSIKPSRFRVE